MRLADCGARPELRTKIDRGLCKGSTEGVSLGARKGFPQRGGPARPIVGRLTRTPHTVLCAPSVKSIVTLLRVKTWWLLKVIVVTPCTSTSCFIECDD
jgi:hypothetical protein